MSEHTPGPWKVKRTPNEVLEIIGTGPEDPEENARVIAEILDADTEAEADARLIAAAPDLLKAAQAIADMAEVLRTGSHTPKMLNATRHKIMRDAANAADIARAAIARAKGGEDA